MNIEYTKFTFINIVRRVVMRSVRKNNILFLVDINNIIVSADKNRVEAMISDGEGNISNSPSERIKNPFVAVVISPLSASLYNLNKNKSKNGSSTSPVYVDNDALNPMNMTATMIELKSDPPSSLHSMNMPSSPRKKRIKTNANQKALLPNATKMAFKKRMYGRYKIG
jgi:hypothetical protein